MNPTLATTMRGKSVKMLMSPATCTFLFDFPFYRAGRFTRRQTLRDVRLFFFSTCDSARFPEGRNKEASKKTFRSPSSARVQSTRNLQTTREPRSLCDFRRACSTHYAPRFPAAPQAFFPVFIETHLETPGRSRARRIVAPARSRDRERRLESSRAAAMSARGLRGVRT